MFMYFCDEAVVLRQRPLRDSDRIVTLFTKNNGRLEVNFKSVRKRNAKLRALSESFINADYRLYAKSGSALPVCTGGKIITSYPLIRQNQNKIFAAFYFCELLINMTPLSQEAKEKFDLIVNALNKLNDGLDPSKWFLVSYALLLLEYSGIGFAQSNAGFDQRLWDALHKKDFSLLEGLSIYDKYFDSVANIAFEKIKEHSARDINSLKFVKIY